jgi:hypothetical protein
MRTRARRIQDHSIGRLVAQAGQPTLHRNGHNSYALDTMCPHCRLQVSNRAAASFRKEHATETSTQGESVRPDTSVEVREDIASLKKSSHQCVNDRQYPQIHLKEGRRRHPKFEIRMVDPHLSFPPERPDRTANDLTIRLRIEVCRDAGNGRTRTPQQIERKRGKRSVPEHERDMLTGWVAATPKIDVPQRRWDIS